MILSNETSPEDLARLFHETYERLAPEHGYETRKDSRTSWEQVPETNKGLMIAVADHILDKLELDSLQEDSRKLSALETAGVDNWEGWDHAMEILREMEG